jgi:adenine-specific DNA-methyltransferase
VSRLTDLISTVKAKDPQLGADLDREYRALSSRLSFGLNFERHRPEAVDLPQCPIRLGDKVRVLPPRGSTGKGDHRLWQVKAIHKEKKRADLESLDSAIAESPAISLDDLVVVAEFRDTIYPGLVPTGKVSRGGDKPWHTVINGENYHVLKALTWTHRGKVDAIYIDPPYNTGAKDWKYNNDYVEGDDLYRHSKWLAMMERRLLLSKELLNPEESVLIVSIDEKEYLHLGLLLEQVFPEAVIQMVTSVINPKGTPKRDYFARVEEYLFIVYMGSAKPVKTTKRMLSGEEGQEEEKPVRWASLLRSGGQSLRSDTEVKFYPIFLDAETGDVTRIGDHVKWDFDIETIKAKRGEIVQWPIRPGDEDHKVKHGCWQVSDETLRQYLKDGRLQIGTRNKKTGRWTLNFLMTSDWERIKNGSVEVVGHDERGTLLLGSGIKPQHGKTVWTMTSHSGTDHGTATLKMLLDGRPFPYPKSLYAVEDTLRFFVKEKQGAIILDFFAGSGTTAHAVMRLNKQDGGRRQCISVTNNEVGPDEQKALREKCLRPGDVKWEQRGICDFITKPRVQAAITGKTPNGAPINGKYKFTDEFPMADGLGENAEFFTLTYETPVAVSYQTAFARIAPLLWLRAGSVGRRIENLPAAGWEVADSLRPARGPGQGHRLPQGRAQGRGLCASAYIVTDDERRFQALARRLPEGVECRSGSMSPT